VESGLLDFGVRLRRERTFLRARGVLPSSAIMRIYDAIDHACEAVIKTRLHALDRIPANDTGWPLKIHHGKPCGFREQPLDASCDPRANCAAKIFALGRNDVAVDGGS